jgi:hypothetical protein
MNLSKNTLLAGALLVTAVLGCGSDDKSDAEAGGGSSGRAGSGSVDVGGDDSGDGDGNGDPTPGATSTYADLTSVAQLIYDAVEADEDVSPHIEAVFEAFGFPVLEPDDEEGALASIEAGKPFVTTRVVEEMAAAYASGRLVDAEGFTEGLVEQGIKLAYPFNLAGELEYNLLGSMIYSFAASAETDPEVPMEEGTVLSSFVRELGQERARRAMPAALDPMWGDARLDPLQFTLLSFTLFSKASLTTKSLKPPADGVELPKKFGFLQSNPAADFIKDQIKGKLKDAAEDAVTGKLQEIVEVPLDKKDAAKVSICGSLILYGHKITMVNTPSLLWHAPKTPNVTKIDLTLTFEDDYYDRWSNAVLGGAVTDLTGCKFPRKGPIEGKAIEWSVTDSLEDHGTFDVTQSVTDDLGQAFATWRTVKDDTPEACQVFDNQRDAVGATEAIVSGLLPGWKTVETIVTFLNPNTGTQGHDPLTVLYYEVSTDDTCHTE